MRANTGFGLRGFVEQGTPVDRATNHKQVFACNLVTGAKGGVKWFRGGLVFKAHRILYHSTLGLRVITKKKKEA